MSHTPALNLPAKVVNAQTGLPAPTLRPDAPLRGDGGQAFRQLLEPAPSPPTNAALDAAADSAQSDDETTPLESRLRSPASQAGATTADHATTRQTTVDASGANGVDNLGNDDRAAQAEARRRSADAELRAGTDRAAPDNTAASRAFAARQSEIDAPRANGAELRQQRLWAEAMQREALPRDAAATAPSTHPQAAVDAATLSAAMAALAAADPQAAAQPRNGNELVAMLQSLCAQMYVTQGPDPNNARMLLDLGHTLPGSLVELAREGAFLRVRLHAADTAAGALMDAQRERLVAALTHSTRLAVVVDVVRTR